jgi:hypothetical protein
MPSNSGFSISGGIGASSLDPDWREELNPLRKNMHKKIKLVSRFFFIGYYLSYL